MSLDTTSFLLGKKAGGGGGTSDYTALSNKPKINNVELIGNKTNIDLGIKDADVNALPENVYFNEIKPGVYFSNSGSANFYENREATKFCTLSNVSYLVIYKTLDSTIVDNETFALCYHFGTARDGISTTRFYLLNNVLSRFNTTLCYTISTNQNSVLEIPGHIGFKKIPYFNSSSMVPTQDTDVVNKKYVDDKSIQASTMPTASSTTVGKIVQYIGTTDSTYTNGYFYIGTTDGASTPTYSWTQLNVQPSSGGGGGNSIVLIDQSTSANYMDLNLQANYDALQEIWDNYSNLDNYNIYLKRTISNAPEYIILSYIQKLTYSLNLYFEEAPTNGYNPNGYTKYPLKIFNITGRFSNNVFERISTSYVDTKYIYSEPIELAGYDATKTQTLKNDKGTLKWIDD